MKRKNTFLAISVLSFIISGAFTIALFTSNSTGKWFSLATLLMCGAAVVFEMSKWCLLWEGFGGKHSGTFGCTLICLWFFVTMGSIVASSGYVLNQSNKTQNAATISSDQYKQAEQSRNVLVDSYNVKKNEIEQLRKQADSLPSNYYSMKQNIMNDVSKKTAELSVVTKQIQNPLEVKGVLVSNGYSAFFGLMARIFEEDAQMIELWFFMALGIILELIANVFAYLYQKESSTKTVHVDEKLKVHTKSEVAPIQSQPKSAKLYNFKNGVSAKKNRIGFNTNETVHVDENLKLPIKCEVERSFTDDDVENYLKVMYATRKPSGDSRGFEKIGAACGLDRKTSEKIKGHLETIGIVKSGPGGTKILKELV